VHIEAVLSKMVRCISLAIRKQIEKKLSLMKHKELKNIAEISITEFSRAATKLTICATFHPTIVQELDASVHPD